MTSMQTTPYGPYVPPHGSELELTIIVKAAPERSKKYGETVCTAGILDDGRLIRIYPVQWEEYAMQKIPKYHRVKVHLTPADEPAKRPESHHKGGAFVPIESPLVLRGGRAPWSKRLELLQKAVTPGGMSELRETQKKHGKSLGIVKVKELVDFRLTAPLDEIIEQADYRISPQQTLTGEVRTEGSKIDKIKHVFRYRWRCHGTCCLTGKPHDTTCEDWELFESFRSWRDRYHDDSEFLEKFKHKYYDTMGQSDLHFVMGTPSNPAHQNSWMIVGLVYAAIRKEVDPNKPTLCIKDLSPEDLLDINPAMDDETETRSDSPKKDFKGGQATLDVI